MFLSSWSFLPLSLLTCMKIYESYQAMYTMSSFLLHIFTNIRILHILDIGLKNGFDTSVQSLFAAQ